MLECLWRGKRARGDWQLAASKASAKALLLELPRKLFAQPTMLWGHWGNFPSEVEESYQKKQFSHHERAGSRVGWGSSMISKYLSYGLNALHFCFLFNISWKRKHCLSWKIKLCFPCTKVETFDNSKAFLKKLIQRPDVKSNPFKNAFIFKELALFDNKVSRAAPLVQSQFLGLFA